jgi:hypothetical protein
MKYFLHLTILIIFFIFITSCNSQESDNKITDINKIITEKISYDTLKNNVGKPRGFMRIREMINDSLIHKVWLFSWDEKGNQRNEFREYNKRDSLICSIDSVINRKGILVRYKQQANENFEGIQLLFDDNGILKRKDITLWINDELITFQKYDYKGHLSYEALIDGNPPERININASKFYEAENIINDKLLKIKISK